VDEKLTKRLIAALDANTKALESHAKLLQAITGKKAPPQPPEPAQGSVDPLTRFLGDR
jgi:hypothetical protein